MDWIATLGTGALLFFLVKGLLWLAVPTALAVWARRGEVRAPRPD